MNNDELLQQRLAKIKALALQWQTTTMLIVGVTACIMLFISCFQWYQNYSLGMRTAAIQSVIMTTQNLTKQLEELKAVQIPLQEKAHFIEQWREGSSEFVFLQEVANILPQDLCLMKFVNGHEGITIEGEALNLASVMAFVKIAQEKKLAQEIRINTLHQVDNRSQFVLEASFLKTAS